MNLVSDSCFRTYLLRRSKIKRPPFSNVQIAHLRVMKYTFGVIDVLK